MSRLGAALAESRLEADLRHAHARFQEHELLGGPAAATAQTSREGEQLSEGANIADVLAMVKRHQILI
jgi:hypothetical protein